uniref:Catalase core domain-containing protein n=1 Tax=Psilocybe cubensis TaxID=181762 RepID=A0A8H8CJ65_PSICU
MPFPTDKFIIQTSSDLVEQLQKLFGKHAGMRPAHAKGFLLTGTFTPSAAAATLSSAPHFHAASTPIIVRFSNSTGIPNIPDNDGNADPRGIAVRFNLGLDANGRRVHTDIIAHSTPFFPTRTGAEFLEFLKAVEASGAGGESPSPVEKFLASHPATVKFVQAPKPAPESFASDVYFGVTAVKLVSSEGIETYVRYRFVPENEVSVLSSEETKTKGHNYLHDELSTRLSPTGSGPFTFKLVAQIAEEGDITDDATVHWPEERQLIELGVVRIEELMDEAQSKKEEKYIIFDPIPRIKGVEPSEDPLLEMRAAVYLISGQQRRAA